MTDLWHVMADSDRQQWMLDPHVSVGPLRFGMGPEDVVTTLGVGATITRRNARGDTTRQTFPELGLTLYYESEQAKLRGISIDALNGPQVRFGDVRLVGRVPSEIEAWVADRAEQQPHLAELFYMPAAECGSFSLGMVVCVQRAGDHLLTRPVFLPSDANERLLFNRTGHVAWTRLSDLMSIYA